ncbi:MAG: DUF4388 domain-containing protein [bacterium]|nr:DUF4388 domain-containing protein [bacterium]
MSLIGSLEDLGLADILQIIHLSQKSGVLSIRGESGEGRIVFRDGLVRLAHLKGDPEDLRGLLVDRGFLSEADFDAAATQARACGVALTTTLSEQTCVGMERIDSLRRECAEHAVGEMFSWATGEFSFDVGTEEELLEGEMSLSTGVNAQYMAMESLRVRDEGRRTGADGNRADGDLMPAYEADDEQTDLNLDLSAEEMFGVVDDSERVAEAMIEVSETNAVRASESPAEPPPAVAPVAREDLPPVVVIDPALSVLEWVRGALGDTFENVHIFQRSQEGLGRVRQYLARAQAPILLVSPGIEGNPLSGIADSADFVTRLRDQAPRMPIVWLVADDAQIHDALPVMLPWVAHPDPEVLSAGQPTDDLARKLAVALLEHTADLSSPKEQVPPASQTASTADAGSDEGLERLKQATQALSEASSGGEILPLVLRFAGESFARVAMFMVRGDQILGMAQHGIAITGGPDDVEMRAFEFERGESRWFSDVIETARPLCAPVRSDGDRRFCELIGGAPSDLAYVAPILSSEQVVALVYADGGQSGDLPGDTSALEVVLHHAGLALERAALARIVWEGP